MLFTQLRFFAFLAIVFVLHWSLRSPRGRRLLLLGASYVFYAGWDARFLALILVSTAVDYVVGLRLGAATPPRSRRAWLFLSLATNLGLLAVFKYFDFFVGSAASVLAAIGLPAGTGTLEIVLPVGISFYTFQTMSYSIDVFRQRLAPVRSVLDFALFVAFFPQLVAGPIVRAREFLPQLERPRRFADVDLRACALLFLVGFAKKACIADNLAGPVDAVFAATGGYGALDLWLAVALYAAQIYCDFSGYSDMAIAVGGLLGFQLPLNFDFPYLARSVTEFWRRWHISLSTWFRDYLYIPLGGSRRGSGRTYRNLVLTFLLCGLWHGANWTFIVWGAWHGVALLVERAGAHRLLDRTPAPLRVAWTLAVVLLGWVVFRAPDLAFAGRYLTVMFGGRAASNGYALWSGWWIVLVALSLVHVAGFGGHLLRPARVLPRWAFAVAYGVAWALLVPWIAVGYQPFIYFQF